MTKTSKSPNDRIASYPWYLEDWFMSETRAAYTLEQRGFYRELLDLCWYHGSLPSDVDQLLKMCGVTVPRYQVDLLKNCRNSAEKMSKPCRNLAEVLLKFTLEADGRYHHPKVDEKRNTLLGRRERMIEGGRRGGTERAKRQGRLKGGLKKAQATLNPTPTPTNNVERKAAALSTRARSSPPPRKPIESANGNGARDPAKMATLRTALESIGDQLGLPPPDDKIVGIILDSTHGAPIEVVVRNLRGLYQKRRFDSIRSWALLPHVLGPWCEPIKRRQSGL